MCKRVLEYTCTRTYGLEYSGTYLSTHTYGMCTREVILRLGAAILVSKSPYLDDGWPSFGR